MIRRSLGWRMATVALIAVALATRAPAASAEDAPSALRDVTSAADVRARTHAAGWLARARPPGACAALAHALEDREPAVREEAAQALGSLGDPDAATALERRSSAEPVPRVKAQIRQSLERLRGAAAPMPADAAASGHTEVRYIISLGAMRNGTGIRGDELCHVLSDAARVRTNALPGASVMQTDASARKQGAARHVPVITLDGNVAQMVESRVEGGVQVHARVVFTVRRDQMLRATVSGAATTTGSGATLSNEARRQLQNAAVDGAVQSALRGAEQGFVVATR